MHTLILLDSKGLSCTARSEMLLVLSIVQVISDNYHVGIGITKNYD